MGRRVAVYGVTEESLRLLPALSAHPDVVLTAVCDPDASTHRRRLALFDPAEAALLQPLLTDDPAALDPSAVDVVIDVGVARRPAPDVVAGVEWITPRQARERWSGAETRSESGAANGGAELLQALEEVLQALALIDDREACATRLLDIAIGASGADGGSLLALNRADDVLVVRAARGLEPALWPQVRLALGEGVAGRVAAELEPRWLRGAVPSDEGSGRAPRPELASALSLPLLGDEPPWGVLNLHHHSSPDAFADWDAAFVRRLGDVMGRIAERADASAADRDRAAVLSAAEAVRSHFSGVAPFEQRLSALCRELAHRTPGGVATFWLESGDGALEAHGGSRGWAPFGRIEAGTGLEGRVAEKRRESWLRDDDGALRAAALPLLADDALIGVLSLQSAEDLAASPGGRIGWRAIGATAAREVARARRAAADADRATRLEALHETALDLLTEEDADRRAERATAAACWLLGAECAVLRVRDAARRSYPVRASSGAAAHPADDDWAEFERRAARRALAERRTIGGRDLAPDSPPPLLVAPLAGDAHPLGTLAVWGRRATERGDDVGFGPDERALLERLARFVAAAWARDAAPRSQGAPTETGLRIAEATLRRRLDEELERARSSGESLAVLRFAVENLDALDASTATPRASRALEAELRPFDRVAPAEPGSWWALLPALGPVPAEHLARLARAVSERVAKDEAGEPVRSALTFGYAIHPGDGESRDALLERASLPRIRML